MAENIYYTPQVNHPMKGKHALVSVIISAHNEEKYVEETLKSIIKSMHSNYEIIVVCDSCSDKTKEVSQKYTKEVFDVKFKNVSRVRNFGAKRAKGDTLVFFDADTLASKNYLSSILAAIKKGFDFGCSKAISETKTLRGRFVTWSINRFNRKNNTVGGNCFVKREWFDTVNGFNASLAKGEDTDFGDRLYQKGARYIFMKGSYIIPSERKFKENGYFRYYFNLLKESIIYTLSKERYKKRFRRG